MTAPGQGALLVSQVEGLPHQRGWVVRSATLRLTLLRLGGHIAEVRLLGESAASSINPFYVPAGTGYSGHLVCFPHYGPASAEEREHGLRGTAKPARWNGTRRAPRS